MSERVSNDEVTWLDEVYYVVRRVPAGSSPLSAFNLLGLPEATVQQLAARFTEDPNQPVEVESYILSRGRLPRKYNPQETFVGHRFIVAPAAPLQSADNTSYLMAMSHEELVAKHQKLQAEYQRQVKALNAKAQAARQVRDEAVGELARVLDGKEPSGLPSLYGQLGQLVDTKKAKIWHQRQEATARCEKLEGDVERLTNQVMTLQGAIGASQGLRMHAMQIISVLLWLEDRAILTDADYERRMEMLLRRARRVHSVWLSREAKEKQLVVPLKELEENEGLEAAA